MSNYVMPSLPNSSMKKAVRKSRAQKPLPSYRALPNEIQKKARQIAIETNVPVEMIREAYSRGLIHGITESTIRALIEAKLLHKTLDSAFSWQKFNEIIEVSAGNKETLLRLIASGVSGEEAKALDMEDPETQRGLDILGMLH